MNSGTATATATYHLRPVHDTHSPPPEFIKPTTPRQRRPLSPSSLRDVDLSQAPDGLPSRKYPAPPTGHDLMAMFPPAPPEAFHEMRPGPTSGFFQKQERAFFAKAGKEIVRVHVEVDFPNGVAQVMGGEHAGAMMQQQRKRGRSASSSQNPPIVGTGARPWLAGPPPPQQSQQQHQGSNSTGHSPVAPSPVPSNNGPYSQHGMPISITTPATSNIHTIPTTVVPGGVSSTPTSSSSSRPPSHRSSSTGGSGMYPPPTITGPGGSPTSPTHPHSQHAPHPSHHAPPPHHAQMMPPPQHHPNMHAHRMPPPPDPMVIQQGGHPHHSPHAPPPGHPGHPVQPTHGMHSQTHSPPRDDGAPPPGQGAVGPYDDEVWHKPTPFADRRRAGKHTKRVIVRT
ncbi:hypothetical protein D9619_008955 [Psilocybe cf. subviscida]|uniref:Uncharacterized protein n=1 Tax=Psilocybe cf. subviscida TaxID=2480587 RepID=A0A8H5BU49_9AGAR|nr:hypothetical protein D9619_008955 [Psilocybe cf. subviscida]